RLRPCRQTHAGLAERRIITGRVELVPIVRRHPQVVIDEPGTAPRIVVLAEQHAGRHPGSDLIARRVAQSRRPRRAEETPERGCVVMYLQPGLALRARLPGLALPHAPPRRLRRQDLGNEPVDDEVVPRTVDVEVEPEREVMVVVHADDVIVDEASVSVVISATARVAALDRLRLDDAGRADADVDRSVLVKDPVENVVVVADHRDAANDEVALQRDIELAAAVTP